MGKQIFDRIISSTTVSSASRIQVSLVEVRSGRRSHTRQAQVMKDFLTEKRAAYDSKTPSLKCMLDECKGFSIFGVGRPVGVTVKHSKVAGLLIAAIRDSSKYSLR